MLQFLVVNHCTEWLVKKQKLDRPAGIQTGLRPSRQQSISNVREKQGRGRPVRRTDDQRGLLDRRVARQSSREPRPQGLPENNLRRIPVKRAALTTGRVRS